MYRPRYGINYMYWSATVGREPLPGRTGGIALMFSMNDRIADNEASDNRDFGILCQQLEHSMLAHNRSAHNGRGFFLENSADNRFVDNRVEDDGVGVFLTAGSEANVHGQLNMQATCSCRCSRIATPRTPHWGAGGGNAWSEYTGLDWNGNGVGDVPHGHLQTRPLFARCCSLPHNRAARSFRPRFPGARLF